MDLRAIIESLIISARKPLSLEQLNLLTGRPIPELARAIAEIRVRFESFGIRLLQVGDGYRFGPHPDSAQWIAAILDDSVPLRSIDSSNTGTVPLGEVGSEGADLDVGRAAEVRSGASSGLEPTFTGPLVRSLTPATAVRGLARQQRGGLEPALTGPSRRFAVDPTRRGVPLRDAKTLEVHSGEHELPDPTRADPLAGSRTEETASREVVIPPLPTDDGETREVPLREIETLAAGERRVAARKDPKRGA